MKALILAGAVMAAAGGAAYAQHQHGGGMNAMPTPQGLSDGPYLEAMTMHHRDGIRMAELAADRTNNAQVRDLATNLVVVQQGELKELEHLAGTAGMQHAGMTKDRGASAKGTPIDDLSDASGTVFDRKFLDLMIKHYQKAVRMSRDADLKNTDLRQFARRSLEDQQNRTKEMQQLRKQIR